MNALPPGPPRPLFVKSWRRLSQRTLHRAKLARWKKRDIAVLTLWSLRHPTDVKTHPLHDAEGACCVYFARIPARRIP